MNWSDIVARAPGFVGGIIETRESDDAIGTCTFRGRIRKIFIKGELFCVETKNAEFRKNNGDAATDPWVNCKASTILACMSLATAWEAGRGVVSFSIPYIGVATLYPRGVLRV